jgi:hypothetical protein
LLISEEGSDCDLGESDMWSNYSALTAIEQAYFERS